MEERLQKVMAHAGVASRRTCEEMIQQGRVRVNGKVVSELGTKVDPTRDIVLVDGSPITGPEAPRYIVLYKPRGHLSAMEPEGGRPCLADLVQVPQRLYPVGRLDLESEGLMLLTNDGELAHRLTHPRYQHPKEYLVLIEGRPGTIALRKLRQGVDVADRLTAPAEVTIVDGPPAFLARPDDARPIPTTWLHMVLREGSPHDGCGRPPGPAPDSYWPRPAAPRAHETWQLARRQRPRAACAAPAAATGGWPGIS